MRLPDSMIWWGGWPWRWRFYFKTIHRGPNGFVGLLLGPVEFLWSHASQEPTA